jgi:hypothetical protein
MFLFRAINDYDVTLDPIKNGLASKEYPDYEINVLLCSF